MQKDKLDSSLIFLLFSHSVSSQLFLKYAHILYILIHQTVYMKYFDDTLSILQNFEKFYLNAENLHEVQSNLLIKSVLENW